MQGIEGVRGRGRTTGRRSTPRQISSRVLQAGCGAVLLLGTLGLAAVAGAGPAGAVGNTYYAAPDGSGDCSSASPCSLSTALADATSGSDTVDLAAGIYTGTIATLTTSVTLQPTVVGSSVVLEGTSASPDNDNSVLTVDAGVTAAVSGVTITGGIGTSDGLGDAFGGGIYNAGTLTLTDATVSGNSLGEKLSFGAGIYNAGTLTVTDATISGNMARGGPGEGGGIFNDGTLTLTDATISGNTAFGFFTDTPGLGGGIYNQGGTVTAGATIIAGNTEALGGNCDSNGGTFTSAGYNLTDDATGTACGFTTSTDVVNADPSLAPLAANGGPTETMLPTGSSPAANVIPPSTSVNGVPVCGDGVTDQRGVPRPSYNEAACTIGAVEGSAPGAPTGVSATPANTSATVAFTPPRTARRRSPATR